MWGKIRQKNYEHEIDTQNNNKEYVIDPRDTMMHISRAYQITYKKAKIPHLTVWDFLLKLEPTMD